MSMWPSYAKIVLNGYGEDFDPSIERTDMERGMPKQSIINSRVLKTLDFTVQFETAVDAQAFEDWYFNDIQRIGFFDFRDPRTRQIRNARIKDAKIGRLTPVLGGFGFTQRTLSVEFLQ